MKFANVYIWVFIKIKTIIYNFKDEVPQSILESHMKNAKEALVNGADNLEAAGLEKSGIAGTEKEGDEEKKEDEKMETDDKEIKKEDEEKKETDAEKEKEATKDTEEKEKNEEKEKEKEGDKEKKPETAVDRLVKVFDG